MDSPAPVYAEELFGDNGADKFRAIALRALHDKKIETDVEYQRVELEKVRQRNAILEAKVEEMNETLEANMEDRERVIRHKTEKINDLEAFAERIQEGMTAEREQAAMKYKTLYNQTEEQRNNLMTQVEELEEQLAGLVDFNNTKAELDEKIRVLEEEKTAIEEESAKALRKMEQRLIHECDRLKKEKDKEVLQCRAEMQSMMENQLDTTTHRTIEENIRMSVELQYQSRQVEKLIKANTELQKQKKLLENQLESQEEMNKASSRKVKFYERLFKKLQLKERQDLTKAQANSFHHKVNTPTDASLKTTQQDSQEDASKRTSNVFTLQMEDLDLDRDSVLKTATDALQGYLSGRSELRRATEADLRYNRYISPKKKNDILRQRNAVVYGSNEGSGPRLKKDDIASVSKMTPRVKEMYEQKEAYDSFVHESVVRLPTLPN